MHRAVVVGAGVVGLYTAIALAWAGYEVTVYEAEAPGAGASTRNANVLHVVQPPPGRARRRLARLGARLHRACSEKLGYRVMETRLVVPALTLAEEALLPLVGVAVKALAPHAAVRLLSRRETLSLEPSLAGSLRRALMVEGYGIVDSREVIRALADALHQAGGDIKIAAVARLVEGGVELSDGTTEEGYDVAVNAAGAGAAALAEASGAGRYRVSLVEGVMRLYKAPRLGSIVAPTPRPGPGKGGALIPQLDGRLLVGPTWGRPGGLTWARYFRLLREPPEGPPREVKGARTVSAGRDFVVARQKLGSMRAVHFIGIESPGLTAAPALAVEALRALGVQGNELCGITV